jgi:hypothetical protein
LRGVKVVAPAEYVGRMARYVFNFSGGDRRQASALLRARLWAVDRGERHCGALAPGDVVLIYVPAPEATFIGRAEIVTAVHDWSPSEAVAYPGDAPCGVRLEHVEEWDPPVPMETVVRRIDPTGTNPLVQANASHGFRGAVVRITEEEYESALALSREPRA